MEDSSLNLFDLVFVSVVLIFGSLAFLKGFIREIFSIFNWISSIVLSYVISPFILLDLLNI